jgi:hypothetical protein
MNLDNKMWAYLFWTFGTLILDSIPLVFGHKSTYIGHSLKQFGQ